MFQASDFLIHTSNISEYMHDRVHIPSVSELFICLCIADDRSIAIRQTQASPSFPRAGMALSICQQWIEF